MPSALTASEGSHKISAKSIMKPMLQMPGSRRTPPSMIRQWRQEHEADATDPKAVLRLFISGISNSMKPRLQENAGDNLKNFHGALNSAARLRKGGAATAILPS